MKELKRLLACQKYDTKKYWILLSKDIANLGQIMLCLPPRWGMYIKVVKVLVSN